MTIQVSADGHFIGAERFQRPYLGVIFNKGILDFRLPILEERQSPICALQSQSILKEVPTYDPSLQVYHRRASPPARCR
jgi:hypothetical protein